MKPLEVSFWMSLVNKHWNICSHALTALNVTGRVLAGVSLLTLSAISVDRLLALLLGPRYRQVVTLKRTYVTVFIFWIVCILASTMYVWNFSLLFFIVMVCQDSYTTLSGNFIVLLHKDFPQVASPWKSSTRQCSRTTEPNDSNEHCTIQKGSFQCTVAAADISCLLSFVFYNTSL